MRHKGFDVSRNDFNKVHYHVPLYEKKKSQKLIFKINSHNPKPTIRENFLLILERLNDARLRVAEAQFCYSMREIGFHVVKQDIEVQMTLRKVKRLALRDMKVARDLVKLEAAVNSTRIIRLDRLYAPLRHLHI
jgi:hypothetical protein